MMFYFAIKRLFGPAVDFAVDTFRGYFLGDTVLCMKLSESGELIVCLPGFSFQSQGTGYCSGQLLRLDSCNMDVPRTGNTDIAFFRHFC